MAHPHSTGHRGALLSQSIYQQKYPLCSSMAHQYSTGHAVPYCHKVCTGKSTPSAAAWLVSTLPVTQYPTVTKYVPVKVPPLPHGSSALYRSSQYPTVTSTSQNTSAVAWLISTLLVTQYPVTKYVPVNVPPLQ